ncbi:MAG: hypothetical protein A2Y22_00890 [Clostridiales bacterium GWD2_32_59]|nr:MAG: hypothetical protein A2Y22_00890 [Clostridiales bacterium GWD2_32_59]
MVYIIQGDNMSVPKIKKVISMNNLIVLVIFENDVAKEYDMKIMISKHPIFKDLEKESLFKLVKVDANGLGIEWNEYLDLSRYEIWENGVSPSKADGNDLTNCVAENEE